MTSSTPRGATNLIRTSALGAVALLALSLGACATVDPAKPVVTAPQPVSYVEGSAPFHVTSMLTPVFDCVRQDVAVANKPVRIAVSDIRDKTGKISYEAAQGGALVSQAGTEMVISALAKLGPNLRQIERYDTAIPQAELALTRQQLIRDGDVLRPVTAGMYEGSDYYITGSISYINGNIRSGGVQLEVNQIGVNNRFFVMDVTMDLRLVRTSDMAIVAVATPTKQIVGRETSNGVFSFFGDYLVDLNFGSRDQEALQLGVRHALEYGVLELIPYAVNSTEPQRCMNYADSIFRK